MASRGYQGLAEVEDAQLLAMRYYWPRGGDPRPEREAKPKEIKLAVADAECSETSGVDGVLHTVWAEQSDRYVTEHDTELVALHDALRVALGRAQELVRQG